MTGKDQSPRLADVDLSHAIESQDLYESRLGKLQSKLSDQSVACYHNKERVIVLLEGWDAAGKGGSIRRMVQKLDPRSCHVYPIAKPNPIEANQHYLQRFWARLPEKGQIAIFDRSWYGRVLVERLEGFAKRKEWQRAYREINQFEKMLREDGIVIIKLFLHISQKEQLKRYQARLDDPRKNWKLTPEDLRNREKAEEYQQAYDDMFEETHTKVAPWHLVSGEHKWFARIRCLEVVTDTLDKHINTDIPKLTAEEVNEAQKLLGI